MIHRPHCLPANVPTIPSDCVAFRRAAGNFFTRSCQMSCIFRAGLNTHSSHALTTCMHTCVLLYWQKLTQIRAWMHDYIHYFMWNEITHPYLKFSVTKPPLKLGHGSDIASYLFAWMQLTHWGRVTHICVSKLTIIGSDNGLSPGRRQAIIWTNAGILLIWPLGTNFNEILIEIHTFSFKKMHLKMSSAKWRPFCLGLNVLRVANMVVCNNFYHLLSLEFMVWCHIIFVNSDDL